MAGFRCTWHIHEAPLVQCYGFFGFDGKEMVMDAEVTCDVCAVVGSGAIMPVCRNDDRHSSHIAPAPTGDKISSAWTSVCAQKSAHCPERQILLDSFERVRSGDFSQRASEAPPS